MEFKSKPTKMGKTENKSAEMSKNGNKCFQQKGFGKFKMNAWDEKRCKNVCTGNTENIVKGVVAMQNWSMVYTFQLMWYISHNFGTDVIDALLMNDGFIWGSYWDATNIIFATRMTILYLSDKLNQHANDYCKREFKITAYSHKTIAYLIECIDYQEVLNWIDANKSALDENKKPVIDTNSESFWQFIASMLMATIWYRDKETFVDILNKFDMKLCPTNVFEKFLEAAIERIPSDMFEMMLNSRSKYIKWFLYFEEDYTNYLIRHRKDLAKTLQEYWSMDLAKQNGTMGEQTK